MLIWRPQNTAINLISGGCTMEPQLLSQQANPIHRDNIQAGAMAKGKVCLYTVIFRQFYGKH